MQSPWQPIWQVSDGVGVWCRLLDYSLCCTVEIGEHALVYGANFHTVCLVIKTIDIIGVFLYPTLVCGSERIPSSIV